jgi:hypothetical protein
MNTSNHPSPDVNLKNHSASKTVLVMVKRWMLGQFNIGYLI